MPTRRRTRTGKTSNYSNVIGFKVNTREQIKIDRLYNKYKIGKYTQTPKGTKLKNRYIVYDSKTFLPISGIKGQTKKEAIKIRQRLIQGTHPIKVINYYVKSPKGKKIATGFFIEKERLKNSPYLKKFKRKFPKTGIFKNKNEIKIQYQNNKVMFRKGVEDL